MNKPMEFEWDELKNTLNQYKHGVDFETAQHAFFDPNRRLIEDPNHSDQEDRFFCLGYVEHIGIITVRYTIRNGKIRIIGAGLWRKGKVKYYDRTS